MPAQLWPWLALAGLGFFHGVNPAMGWLFAVALGLHRRRRAIVLLSLVPIALGHAAAIAIVIFLVLALGVVVDHVLLGRAAGPVLIASAVWHAAYGHPRRVPDRWRTDRFSPRGQEGHAVRGERGSLRSG